MRYGYFAEARREYVIERVDLPVSWTNYLGVEDLCAVVNHTAGGYLFYRSPEHHRITRFRANGVPADRPGHYIYIRDDDTGEFWSVSREPCGGPLAAYSCRHGLSYTVYTAERAGIKAEQTLFIPRGEAAEIWDLALENRSEKKRRLSLFSYAEFSFHEIPIDNQNFQMSLYCAGSSYADGIIDYHLFYEGSRQFMAADFEPDGFDAVRDRFIGLYRSENNPVAVETGQCSRSTAKGGNHCAVLQKKLELQPGESARLAWFLGEGGRAEGQRIRAKYRLPEARDRALEDLAAFWEEKLTKFQVKSPNRELDLMINTWTFYQSEINVLFSRFASFIEVGGRTGLGFRDTAQDAMTIPHAEPAGCRKRLEQLLQGLTSRGYGLHLFDPAWFEPAEEAPAFRSPTVVPTPPKEHMIHGLEDACSDDALWLVAAVCEYIRESGERAFVDELFGYADGGEGTVYEHLRKILDFSWQARGAHGICLGLRADWNDCLNLGGGESALTAFLLVWALGHFVALADFLGRREDAACYEARRRELIRICEEVLWDGEWYIRGITADGRRIGTRADKEGRIHLESNAWAILSGAASPERAELALDSVDRLLYTPYGLLLNAPSYTEPDDAIGFVTRVYPGIKENGSVFSHSNPWAWGAAAKLGRGSQLLKFCNALCPAKHNDKIEIRQSEPYSTCQFIIGPDHEDYGRACHPFMTGSGGWSYFAATRYLLGIVPDFDGLIIDPCIAADWEGFAVERVFRGALYKIKVENPEAVEKGVREIFLNGAPVRGKLPVCPPGSCNEVLVIMGRRAQE